MFVKSGSMTRLFFGLTKYPLDRKIKKTGTFYYSLIGKEVISKSTYCFLKLIIYNFFCMEQDNKNTDGINVLSENFLTFCLKNYNLKVITIEKAIEELKYIKLRYVVGKKKERTIKCSVFVEKLEDYNNNDKLFAQLTGEFQKFLRLIIQKKPYSIEELKKYDFLPKWYLINSSTKSIYKEILIDSLVMNPDISTISFDEINEINNSKIKFAPYDILTPKIKFEANDKKIKDKKKYIEDLIILFKSGKNKNYSRNNAENDYKEIIDILEDNKHYLF